MLKLCLDSAHSMFNDGYSSTRNGEEIFGHRAVIPLFVIQYILVIFCECGQIGLFCDYFFFLVSFGRLGVS